MEISVPVGPLSDALQVSTRLVGARPSRVGGGVLLEARTSGGLSLTGTDLTTVFSTEVGGVASTEGEAVVSGKWLQDVVKVLQGDTVQLKASSSDNAIELTSGKSRFVLRTIPRDAFPAVSTDVGGEATTITLEKGEFDTAIAQVVVAAGVDEARPVFTGCLLDVAGERMKVVATDSYRLAERIVEVRSTGEPRRVVVGARVLEEVARLKGDHDGGELKILLGDDSAAMQVGKNVLRSRYIEGTFPDYERLIPTDNPNRCVAVRPELIEAIRRVSVLARDVTPVKMRLSSEVIEVEVKESEVGEAKEEVESAEYSGGELEIAFNPKYLLDALGGCEGEKVSIEIKDPLSAVLVRGEERGDYRHLVMPIRL